VGERSIPLKRNPRRTVERRLPDAPSGPSQVVKRFHHPGTFARLLDGARAAQELRVLRALEARGVAVPRPIGTRRVDGGTELVTEWIEGAVPLDGVLRGSVQAPAAAPAILRRAAETLARAHAAGLVHEDLHPGNLVAQPGGATWIVDVRGARIGRGFDPTVARRDLVALASAVRERTEPALRARFLVAYARALPASAAARLPALPELALEVEARARIHRREAVRRARKRWMRLSSACRTVARPDFEGFASVEAREERLPVVPDDRFLVLRDRPWRELLRAWYAAARLCEHGIPAARPWALARGPDRSAAFALPAGARAGDRTASAAERAELARALADRGLALAPQAAGLVRADARGAAWIAPLDCRDGLLDFDVEDAAP
jgi:tRNA A-37 threonylcarbamoyl transferase component Bud32